MIRCYFCRTAVTGVEAAVQFGWTPSFYASEREVSDPVCPDCTSDRLRLADDGEFELFEHARYAGDAESAQRDKAWPQAAALWQAAAFQCHNAQRRGDYERQAAWCREMARIGSNPETQ